LWFPENGLCIAVFHNPALPEYQQFVAECANNGQIMTDKDVA
jgi:hypothetical protein